MSTEIAIASAGKLSKLFESGDWVTLGLVALFALPFVVSAFKGFAELLKSLGFLESAQIKKEQYLKETLKSELLDKDLRQIASDSLGNLIFRRVTGIMVDEHVRLKIQSLVAKNDGEITLLRVRLAASYIKRSGEKLKVSLMFVDLVGYWVGLVFAGILLVIGALALPVFINVVTSSNAAIGAWFPSVILFILAFAMSGTIIAFIAPIGFARQLAPVLEKVQLPSGDERDG